MRDDIPTSTHTGVLTTQDGERLLASGVRASPLVLQPLQATGDGGGHHGRRPQLPPIQHPPHHDNFQLPELAPLAADHGANGQPHHEQQQHHHHEPQQPPPVVTTNTVPTATDPSAPLPVVHAPIAPSPSQAEPSIHQPAQVPQRITPRERPTPRDAPPTTARGAGPTTLRQHPNQQQLAGSLDNTAGGRTATDTLLMTNRAPGKEREPAKATGMFGGIINALNVRVGPKQSTSYVPWPTAGVLC